MDEEDNLDEYNQDLTEELERFVKDYPRLGRLFVEMMNAVSTHENALEALNQHSAHLEAGKQDHDWKISVLKDLAVQTLKRSDPTFEINLPGFDEPTDGQLH